MDRTVVEQYVPPRLSWVCAMLYERNTVIQLTSEAEESGGGSMMHIHREAAPLRVQAVAVLRQRIIEGTYKPGERLVERRLEEDLGVSRTVVREALRQLESQRLIYLKPGTAAPIGDS